MDMSVWSPSTPSTIHPLVWSPTLHVGAGERWKSSLPLHYSFTDWLKLMPSPLILLSTANSQVSNKVKSHPFFTTRRWHVVASPCISEEAAINGLPSFSPLFPSPALPITCNNEPYSHHHIFTPPLWAVCRKSEPPLFTQWLRYLSLPLPFDHRSTSSSRSATHSLVLPPTQPKPLPSGDDLFVYLDSKVSRAGTVSNCVFVLYLQLCWTEYTHCHLLLETKFLLGASSTEK